MTRRSARLQCAPHWRARPPLITGTRVRLRVRTLFGWRGCATYLEAGRAIKDGGSDPFWGTVDACDHEWAVMRDQTPNPEHTAAVALIQPAGRLPGHSTIPRRPSMVKASELYSGNYLTAAELPAGRHNATIFGVEVEMIGQGQDQSQKLVLSLTSAGGRAWPKTIVLNKTNSLALATAFGDETDDWPGKRVQVWTEMTMFQGKRVPGLRVDAAPASGNGATAPPAAASPPVPPAPARPAPAARPSPGGTPSWGDSGNELDDEVPF